MADQPADDSPAGVGDRVERWLLANSPARPLEPPELERYRAEGAVRGWRIPAEFGGEAIDLDLTIDRRFPRSRPEVALASPPAFPSFPHVEEDGGICAIEQIDELDPAHPIGIIKAALGGAADVLEQGLSGTNRDEFRREFLSYWEPTAKGATVDSIVDPCGGTRRVKLWRGAGGLYVAEDRKALTAWLANRAGRPLRRDQTCDPALLLWLGQPLLPADYPDTPADLRRIAAGLGADALAAFDAFLQVDLPRRLILLGAPTQDGPCFAAVTVERARRHGWTSDRKGTAFRKGRKPAEMVAAEAMAGSVTRHRVRRADPYWVHGRDSNPDVVSLLAARIVMVGCGSLGAPLARLLAQAGVGTVELVDPELLTHANTSRHVLGGGVVGQNKAKALALRLQRDFPHLTVIGHDARWQDAVKRQPDLLAGADLVISTIGSWSHEGELNEHQLAQSMPAPTLYAWLEPRAAAGHAVLIGATGGCLACGLDSHGRPLFQVAEFAGATLKREPACGSYFQPYGAAEVNLVAGMAAGLALDALLGRATSGAYRILSGREAAVAAAGGTWTTQWQAETGGRPSATLVERSWQHDLTCAACASHKRG